MKVKVGYPSAVEEKTILDRALVRGGATINAVITPEVLITAQGSLDGVHIDERIKDYIVTLVRATRDPKAAGIRSLDGMIQVGASPRAVIGLAHAARAQAALESRAYVTPQDVKTIAADVLRHRLQPSYEAEAEQLDSDALISRLLDHTPVP